MKPSKSMLIARGGDGLTALVARFAFEVRQAIERIE
jgi:hypothetical protein